MNVDIVKLPAVEPPPEPLLFDEERLRSVQLVENVQQVST